MADITLQQGQSVLGATLKKAAKTIAVVCLLALAACSGGGPGHTASARGTPASGVPAPVVIRGTLTAGTASTVYNAAIAPAYPLALQVADALAHHPAAAAAKVANFTARLSEALGSFRAVTAFPADAQRSFAAYRADAAALLGRLASPAAVVASERTRQRAALELYAFASQIGVLGTDLNLVPATEQGGKH